MMTRTTAPPRIGPVVAALVLLGTAGPLLSAQQPRAGRPAGQPVALSAVITAFLVDSGVQTRGLPWTTGSSLPIRWESAAPVANPDQFERRQGLALVRNGQFTGTVGDTVALAMTIRLGGTQAGLARVGIHLASLEVTRAGGSGFFLTREMVENALRHEGLTLQPIKCSRDKEGASYGNLVDAVKAPGKGASGLWWMWDSPMQAPNLSLTILYRRAEMAQVECQEG